MSYPALRWFTKLPLGGFSKSELVVLAILCDVHNTTNGCFPTQAYICTRANLSNGAVNNALRSLEKQHILQRQKCWDTVTKRQKPTQYFLNLEMENSEQNSTRKTKKADSTLSGDPSPDFEHNRLHTGGVINRDEPVKEPVSNQNVSQSSPQLCENLDEICQRFKQTYPRPGVEHSIRHELAKALENGVDPQVIIGAAKTYANEKKGTDKKYICFPENWLKNEHWQRYLAPQPLVRPTEAQMRANKIAAIKSGQRSLCSGISREEALNFIREGEITVKQARDVDLVTVRECRQAGIVV